MKKLLIFTALFSTFLFSCKPKKDDPAPATNTTNTPSSNFGGQIGFLSFYSAYQYTRLHNSTKSTPNYSTSYSSNPAASFYNAEGKPSAVGSVSFAETNLTYMSSYYISLFLQSDPSFPLYWKIGSGNGFPAAEVKMTAKPDTFSLAETDFVDSISTSVPYTIKVNKKLTNADKITIALWKKEGTEFSSYTTTVFKKEVAKGLDTFTFSAAELSKISSPTWKTGQIQILCSNDTTVSIGSTTYNFSTESSIKLDVYFK